VRRQTYLMERWLRADLAIVKAFLVSWLWLYKLGK
jgi:acyl CoA:acetate/3-ketoacid CoA transferase alpha subunit